MADRDSSSILEQRRNAGSGIDAQTKRAAAETGSRIRRAGRSRSRDKGVEGATRADALTTAALELFAERNFASVTIRDIARATGINSAMIYYYFGSKQGLFLQTIENAVEEVFVQFDNIDYEEGDSSRIISSWLDNHLHLYERIHRFVKISLDYKGAQERDPAIDQAIKQFYSRERQLLAGCIRAGVEKKIYKPVNPEKIAQFISTCLDGAMVRAVILPDFELSGAVADLREITWELLGYEPEN